MGHGGDELRLHLLAPADLQGHLVDIVHQLPHFILVFIGDLDAVAAIGNALGGLGHLCHRGGDPAHKHQVHAQHHAADDGCQAHDGYGQQGHLLIKLPRGGDQAQSAYHAAVILQGCGHGQNILPGKGVPPGEGIHSSGIQGPAHLRGLRGDAHGLTPAGNFHAAIAV